MLSRTADHLFWLARYMERAENTARMLDVNYQTSLLPQSAELAEQGWHSLLSISELSADYQARYGEVEAKTVKDFIVRDAANPSSIISCLRAARENARAVRGTLTTEVWETTNHTWLEFNRLLKDGLLTRDPASLFEWVKFRSHLSRGVTVGTMLQDEAFDFLRIGSFLERADNTARLLDVKFHRQPAAAQSQRQSQGEEEGPAERDTARDFYHWSAILRSVSAFEIYRKVYSNVIQPDKVAELLILRANMPRSLAHCMGRLISNLKRVANDPGGETMRQAGKLRAELEYAQIDEIIEAGLHAFLTQFLERVNALGAGISRDFIMMPSS
ncbi:alpha-E domain-containing protein [Roseateles violae]|uniref:Alpha-E domain-containing protein n=1 Tax=Roseateles violae TaxID=3058042 RepID=A0ABT8DXU5_9BURK|nr:alpha-E domain-containing protein [Pelomonas sp. PFR6]MDN3922279.1 alpha-E domain-containing protein [Pelomonas sp. PFR6]